ncbi:MAG: C25 family cysteine peptidase [Flammeovirgaceae bacterium]
MNNTLTAKKIFAASQVNSVSIKPISFRNLSGRSPSFIIITHKVLMQPAGGYANPVQAYAAYRASVQGGGYDTLVLTMDQVYNQFNYGETSALALYECMNYWIDTANPKFLFLIGKGRDINGFSAYQRKTPPVGDINDLVPSAGMPASDIAYTAGLSSTSFYPKIATGRLPATQAAQVANYLNKVKEIESAPVAAAWKKNGLHLSGGIQPIELPLFRSYVDGFKQIAIKDFWGASVTTIGKRDPNPVQLINVADQINKGVNLITFFGHSSPGTIDIDIGFASDPVLGYNNAGKYPVFLINGCNVGSFFLNGTLFGEDWILSANKGARNFIAHSSFGFANTLKAYSDLFYQVGFADSVFIQRGVGEVQQEVAKRYLNLYGNSMSSITQVQQMIMLGDPALKLFGTSKPDFSIGNNSVTLQSLDGTPVTALSQVFALKIIIKNTGATTSKKLPVRVLRTFSDNSTVAYDSVFASPLNQDTVLFRIRRDSRGGGQNTFTVTLDQGNTIAETSKLNNSTVFTVLIPSNATKNLFPTPYSIVATTSVNFLFQSTNLLGDKRDFRFELDTVASFNSPLLKQQTINAKVLAKTLLNLPLRDSTTYYWRTRLDKPTASESAEWNTSSFTYIKNGSEGWGQFQFPQLADNPVAGILKDAQNRKLKYLETVLPVAITTYGSGYAVGATTPSVKINNIEYNLATQGQPCRTNTINILAFDKTTGVPYAGIPFNFQDPRTCGREPQVINSYTLAEMETGLDDDLIATISNIKQSDSVVLFSIGDASYSAWSVNLKNKLAELGIGFSQISSLQEGEPLVIFGRKNATAGTAKIFRALNAPANQQLLQVSSQISARFSSGTIQSPLIGPANKWFNFFNQVSHLQTSDQFYTKVYGVDLYGNERLLLDNIVTTVSLSTIDAVQFPYLRLELNMQDAVNLTPVQLKNWLVTYESVAEGILVYRGDATPVSVQEGQSVDLPFAFVNLSSKNFKSPLTVQSEVISQSTSASKKSITSINPPTPNDSTKFMITLETRGKVGRNDVAVFVNPRIVPELHFENNALLLSDFLQVMQDKTAPVLMVQIDGRIILNNDYVSPNPRIEISVKDENQFFFKTDTVGVTLFLKQDCQACNYQPIYFSRPDVTWLPATRQSDFIVNFNPQNLVPGDYVLRAQAQDATGNKAGATPYEIAFRVRDTHLLTLRSVYPNPSRGKFYFNFLLIGNELPTAFSLQVYTLSGKCIQNFTSSEIDLFHIGTNELTWEGTDEEGNALPSGVYVYKFSVSTPTTSAVQQGKLIVIR